MRPLSAIAEYIAGVTPDGEPRHVEVVSAQSEKHISFRVRFPEEAKQAADNGKKIWDPLSDQFREVIDANRSTLFFTNSRRLAEKITLKINEDQLAPLAYAHHGSLSRDIRTEVEHRLKSGELRAIVATNSLEMGIDIGALDEVVMVQSPPSIAATLQRIGRAGHQVGATSVGTVYPTHAADFLEAAVLAKAVAERDIEPLTPLENPLDVLVQVIVSCAASEAWSLDALYALITKSGAFRTLPRKQFDLVIEMLVGRYAGSRVRELKPRVTVDRVKQTVQASKGALFALYNSGGNIPDRGYYKLKHADTGTVIGELDEEFVWEATVGDVFTLGTQNWRVNRITHNDVLVRTAKPTGSAPPFWRSETFNRSEYFSTRMAEFLTEAEEAFEAGDVDGFKQRLLDQAGFEESAATELVDFLTRQREVSEAPLPHRHHLLMELVEGGPDGYRGPDAPQQYVMHTLWGGQLNQPYALALSAALQREGWHKPEVHADNNAIVIQCKANPDAHDILRLVSAENLDELLREALEGSGFFGARFREAAGRSLLLTKQRFNQRLPLWMSRLQAKKLFTATKQYTDFPVLLETWRTCLKDEFDLPALRERLAALVSGELAWTFVHTRAPSPFASAVRFAQVSRYMYADDTPDEASPSALQTDLIQQAVNDASLRPPLTLSVIEAFVAKRQRTAPGYAPATADELVEWLKERVLIPLSEWQQLLRTAELEDFEHEHIGRLQASEAVWLTHRDYAAAWLEAGLGTDLKAPLPESPADADTLAVEALSFYGPLRPDEVVRLSPLSHALARLHETWIRDVAVEGSDQPHLVDPENLDTLLRFQRAAARSAFEARPAADLPHFWATWQRLAEPWQDSAAQAAHLEDLLEQLAGYPAHVASWLRDFLQARLPGIADHHVDEAFARRELAWLGMGEQRITIAYPEDAALLGQPTAEAEDTPDLSPAFRDPAARYTYHQLADAMDTDQPFEALWWPAVWAGQLTADSLSPLRDGLQRRFQLEGNNPRQRSRVSRVRHRVAGWSGNWSLLTTPEDADVLQQLEDSKERVRILLDRYGFVCRELVVREGRRWRDVFHALRIMELGGEVSAGYYFEGLSGPQFIAASALQALELNRPGPKEWWVAANDPASPCGLGLDWPALPHRRPGNFLCFAGSELVLVAENAGARLRFLLQPHDERLTACHSLLHHLVSTHRRIVVAEINGDSARKSPYLGVIERTLRVVPDHKGVTIEL